MRGAALSWGAAGALALAVALPAVWWEPLHVDEWVTLSVAPRPPAEIVREIVVERGGAPLHFLLEHLLLQWPGGVEGLRLPSLLAFVAALPAAGLLAGRLAGRAQSLLLPAALALAPLAVELATFGRMYGLFLASYLWATYAALMGAERGTFPLLLGSAALGALVYVHPISPVYGIPALVGVILVARVRVRPALAALAVSFAAGAPYWAYALWRLRERYYVGYPSSKPVRATAGRSVVEDSLYALTPGEAIFVVVFAGLAVAGGIALYRAGKRRHAGVIAAWVLLPVLFFAIVRAGGAGSGARFYPRYLLPALPWFLLLVLGGCLAARRGVAVALIASVLVLQVRDDAERLQRLRAIGLQRAVATIEARDNSPVLEPAGGRAVLGRPAYLLDEFVALRLPGSRRTGEGLSVKLVGGPPPFVDQFEARLAAQHDGRAIRISPRLLLVESAVAAPLPGVP